MSVRVVTANEWTCDCCGTAQNYNGNAYAMPLSWSKVRLSAHLKENKREFDLCLTCKAALIHAIETNFGKDV